MWIYENRAARIPLMKTAALAIWSSNLGVASHIRRTQPTGKTKSASPCFYLRHPERALSNASHRVQQLNEAPIQASGQSDGFRASWFLYPATLTPARSPEIR